METYRYNFNINSLEIDPSYLCEGLLFAEKNKCYSIRIKQLITGKVSSLLSINEFNEFTSIQKLDIEESVDVPKNIDLVPLYCLKSLNKYSFYNKNISPNFSKLPQLEALYFKYNKGIKNLGALKNLKDLLIFSLNVPNCEILSELSALEMLRLTRGNFTTLQSIETLKKVKRFDVAYNSKLINAEAIADLSSLEKLHIEKCKLLTDFSFLKGNTSIKELFIDNLDSIDFIASMPNLERINFWNCKDGDMTPLLESKNLQQINFYPNKKHYTHTIEKVIELTGARRGRNK